MFVEIFEWNKVLLFYCYFILLPLILFDLNHPHTAGFLLLLEFHKHSVLVLIWNLCSDKFLIEIYIFNTALQIMTKEQNKSEKGKLLETFGKEKNEGNTGTIMRRS